MIQDYLTLEQNTCAARIFLNTFGLTLETTNNVNEFSKLKIFDKNMIEVGKLHFKNGKVIIQTHYNDSILEASFEIAKISGFRDIDYKNALFGQWYSTIVFQLQKQNHVTLSGEFLIENSVDSEFGATCICHPLIIYKNPERTIVVAMLRNGTEFYLKNTCGNHNETITIRPHALVDGFIKHDITDGKYDEETHSYKYRKYCGIFNGPEIGEDKDKLHVFLKEERGKKRLTTCNEWVSRVGSNNSKESLIQKGQLMQKLDPDMFYKIKELRNILSIGDVSLFDNLISVCYDIYTNEELIALFGIERKAMSYQNGAKDLVTSYYEIGEKSHFLPVEVQKKLLKK